MGTGRLGLSGRRWIWLLLFVALCGFAAAFFLFNSEAPSANKPSFSASAPKEVACLGRLLPGGRILQVAAPSGSVIGELLVRRGQWVERGDVLARLRDYERSRKLHEKQIISSKEFEEAQTRRDTARESLLWERRHLAALRDVRKEDVALAGNKVEAAEGARKVARENAELNLIRAPVSGRVLEIYAFPGEAATDRGLLELGSGRDMMVEAEVYVSDIGRVRIGAPAVISGDAFRGRLAGKVIEIVSMVARSDVIPTDPLAFSDQRIVKVWIRLDDSSTVAGLGNHQVSVVIKP